MSGDNVVLPGAAGVVIRVTRVFIDPFSTAPAATTFTLIKRSAADTLGTSAAITVVPMDSNNSASAALPLTYSVAPTPGAAVGTLWTGLFNVQTAVGVTDQAFPEITFGQSGQELVLRGTAQQLCINANNTNSGFTGFIEYTEDASN